MKVSVDLGARSGLTIYTVGEINYPVRYPYYLGSCDHCGWIGSTEQCGGDEDVVCPKCYSVGADCGKVALAADDAERRAQIASKTQSRG